MKTSKETKVRLLSWTANPLETIYAEWCASRPFVGPVVDPQEMAIRISEERQAQDLTFVGPVETQVRKVFEEVVTAKIPVSETIDFVFLIENCPIALREQMVRHRIGHKFGTKLGVDIIPDIAESTWWGQTMRVQDMGRFAAEGHYLTPEWLKQHGDETMPGFNRGTPEQQAKGGVYPLKTIAEFYHEQMAWIQVAYKRLVNAGMPTEDARNVLPLGCSSDNIWKMNLSALQHVLSKRGCWIAQLGMWEPVIRGLVEELATKVDPYFRKLIDPPCIGPNGQFNTCVFKVENQNRLPGEADPYPPCSLWVCNDYAAEKGLARGYAIQRAVGAERSPEFTDRAERYAALWGRDPYTGERRRLA